MGHDCEYKYYRDYDTLLNIAMGRLTPWRTGTTLRHRPRLRE